MAAVLVHGRWFHAVNVTTVVSGEVWCVLNACGSLLDVVPPDTERRRRAHLSAEDVKTEGDGVRIWHLELIVAINC